MSISNSHEFESYFFPRLKKYYHFAFSLLPDDLQAHQIVVDAFTALATQLYPIEVADDTAEKISDFCDQEKKIYQSIYQIARRRVGQLTHRPVKFSSQILGVGDHASFFTLNFEERAVLFLTLKTNYKQNELMEIIQCSEQDYRKCYFHGEKKMNLLFGDRNHGA